MFFFLSLQKLKIMTKEPLSTSHLLHRASIAGILLGAISTVSILLALAINFMESSFIKNALVWIVWFAQIAGCIWTMRYCMLRLVRDYANVTNNQTLLFGIITAGLSALICAAAEMANILYITPESIDEAQKILQATMTASISKNNTEALQSISENLVTISFWSQLIYCFVYGTVLSLILSKNIPSRNPFAADDTTSSTTDDTTQDTTQDTTGKTTDGQ